MRACVCGVCVCVRERERERESIGACEIVNTPHLWVRLMEQKRKHVPQLELQFPDLAPIALCNQSHDCSIGDAESHMINLLRHSR